MTLNHWVVGSSPTGGTTLIHKQPDNPVVFLFIDRFYTMCYFLLSKAIPIYPDINNAAPKIDNGIADTKSTACESFIAIIAIVTRISKPIPVSI